GQVAELGGEAVVLVLVGGSKSVGGRRSDVAQRHVGVAALGKERTGGVGVPAVSGAERNEGRGEFALDVPEVVVGEGDLGFPVVVDFPIDADLRAVEPFVGGFEFFRT